MNQINIFIFIKKSAGLMNQTPTDCPLHIPVDNLYYILRRVALISQAPPFLHLGSAWSFDDPRNNRNLYSP